MIYLRNLLLLLWLFQVPDLQGPACLSWHSSDIMKSTRFPDESHMCPEMGSVR